MSDAFASSQPTKQITGANLAASSLAQSEATKKTERIVGELIQDERSPANDATAISAGPSATPQAEDTLSASATLASPQQQQRSAEECDMNAARSAAPNDESEHESSSTESDSDSDERSDSYDDDLLAQEFASELRLSDEDFAPILPNGTLSDVAELVRGGKIRKIIVMTGAGISTAAGIPDFRTPGTGLYDNLAKFKLPYAEAIFDIDFFHKRPEPFFALAKELYPGQFKPTLSHYFIRLLAEKQLLLRNYTQNIDTLERAAGIDGDKLVEAHGSFHLAHCLNNRCGKQYNHLSIKEKILSNQIPRCDDCRHLVKPAITFFGEQLPDRFHALLEEDFPQSDLLLVMGTSLKVHPFASLINMVRPHVPRVLINMESCGTRMPGGFRFSSPLQRDVQWLGACDDGCLHLAELLGWKDELMSMAGITNTPTQ